MDVREFCARYMGGMTPVTWQREAIEAILVGRGDEVRIVWGIASGKTTFHRAVARYYDEHPDAVRPPPVIALADQEEARHGRT